MSDNKLYYAIPRYDVAYTLKPGLSEQQQSQALAATEWNDVLMEATKDVCEMVWYWVPDISV